jgi:hypothetical protein
MADRPVDDVLGTHTHYEVGIDALSGLTLAAVFDEFALVV